MGCLPYEEIIKNFSIGDLVELISDNDDDMSATIGAKAVVIGFEESVDCFVGEYYLKVKWVRNGFDNWQCDGAYYADDFLNISRGSEKETTNKCPRCGGELKEKQSYALNEIIKKCISCGWC